MRIDAIVRIVIVVHVVAVAGKAADPIQCARLVLFVTEFCSASMMCARYRLVSSGQKKNQRNRNRTQKTSEPIKRADVLVSCFAQFRRVFFSSCCLPSFLFG